MASFETVKNKYKSLRFNSIASSLDTLVKQAEGNEISYLQFAEKGGIHFAQVGSFPPIIFL